jgi:hypothetical protein
MSSTQDRPLDKKKTEMRIGLAMNNYSFEWMGRNREGVSRWKGNSSGPPARMGKILKTYGMVAGITGVTIAILGPLLHWMSAVVFPLVLVGIVHGIVFSLLGAWITRIRRRISTLKQPDEVCEVLGIPDEELHEMAAERGVKPKMIINNRPLYDLAEFSDAHTLLRGSSAPVFSDSLLRAVTADSQTTPAGELLRASGATAESRDSTQVYGRSGITRDTEPQEQTQKIEV